MNLKVFVTATALCVLTASALAQSTTTSDPDKIADRKHEQQQRIGQGVQSGQLTPKETKNLEKKEVGINREERNMRRADDGHLTAQDRKALNRRQNHVSKAIYKDKHNARHQGPA